MRTESQMRSALQNVLVEMRRVLDATRHPKHAADVPHTYTDKFTVVERATQVSICVRLSTLVVPGCCLLVCLFD